MVILLTFAFLAGVATVLSPCILPVLPIVLASAFGSSRWRPLGVVIGLVVSFAFFTLALTTLVSLLGLSPDVLRLFGATVILLFGVVLLFPTLQRRFDLATGALAVIGNRIPGGDGFWGGALVGGSLGLVWAPCAGPILASITTLVATNQISPQAVAVTMAYAVGTGVPMLLIAYGGRRAITRVRLLSQHTGTIQRAFGAVMVFFALTFYAGVDRTVQLALTNSVPAEWTGTLTSIENLPAVQTALSGLNGTRNITGSTPQSSVAGSSSGPVGPLPPASTGSTNQPAASAPTVAPPMASTSRAPSPRPHADLPDMGPAPDLRGITGWINGGPTSLPSLKGKVVLVDFWTYSCINCLRTLPYVKQWNERYRDSGLVVIGVHTPEFEFEKSNGNVTQAVNQNGIKYLVAQDNGYATWQAYNNHYWPAKYLIDANGHIRYTHFGEGQYDETEAAIRALLDEAGTPPAAEAANMPDYSLAQNRTPELYLGAFRQSALSSPEQYMVSRSRQFSTPEQLPLHHFALTGNWTVEQQDVVAAQGSSLDLQFSANDVYLVLTPGESGDQLSVMLDGQPIREDASGADVHGGSVSVNEARLYHLVDLRGNTGQHRLSITFLKGDTKAFSFTFG